MKTYLVTFERIGRRRHVAPLTCEVDGPNHLAELIHKYARPHLGSRYIEVAVDLSMGTGLIFAGVQIGGRFTVVEQAVSVTA